MSCLAKIVNKRIDGSIHLFQEILQTGKECALFAIYMYYYNKNVDTKQQRKQLSAI